MNVLPRFNFIPRKTIAEELGFSKFPGLQPTLGSRTFM